MDFATAITYMKRGHKVTLPEWGGYWYWKDEATGIMIVTYKDEEFPLLPTTRRYFSTDFFNRADFELFDDSSLDDRIEKHTRRMVPIDMQQEDPELVERIRAAVLDTIHA